jgi:UDP-N-acetylglucosamine:LPS N-acetylglucosamine transferase
MRIRVLIIVGGGGWGREAMEIVPALNPGWEKIYLSTPDCVNWLRRNGLEGEVHLVPPITTGAKRSRLVRIAALFRALWGVTILMLRKRPRAVLGICSDLSLPAMLLGRLLGARTYYVESLTRVRTPSRVARLLDRLGIVNRLFVQHESLTPQFKSGEWIGGIL